MSTFQNFLIFLDGKKAIIGGLLNAINAYLVTASVYNSELGALIATVFLILTGVGIQQSNKLLGKRKRVLYE